MNLHEIISAHHAPRSFDHKYIEHVIGESVAKTPTKFNGTMSSMQVAVLLAYYGDLFSILTATEIRQFSAILNKYSEEMKRRAERKPTTSTICEIIHNHGGTSF